MTIPHILIVDDDTRIRELLGRYLRDHDFYVTTAKDAAEARARLQDFVFDLMVLDVMMPGETGMELAASLRTHSDLPILMLTAMGEARNRIEGLESGADDYLVKPFEPKELLLRIRTILRRTMRQKGDDVAIGALHFNLARAMLFRGEENIPLTQAEANLLSALASHSGMAVSRETLAEKLGSKLNERSIDVQITRLRQKIEPDPKQPRYLQTVRGEGYVLYSD